MIFSTVFDRGLRLRGRLARQSSSSTYLAWRPGCACKSSTNKRATAHSAALHDASAKWLLTVETDFQNTVKFLNTTKKVQTANRHRALPDNRKRMLCRYQRWSSLNSPPLALPPSAPGAGRTVRRGATARGSPRPARRAEAAPPRAART